MPVPQYQVIGPWTVNNYTDDDLDHVRSAVRRGTCRYVVFCHEVGAEGTRHLQGFASAFKKHSLKAWHQILGPRFALAPDFFGVKSIPDCIQYCKGFERELEDGVWTGKYKKKAGSGDFEEYGSYNPGKREDLLCIKRRIDDGDDPQEIVKDAETFNTMAKHMKFFKEYQVIVQDVALKRRRIDIRDCRALPKVYIRWGEEDTGKTHWIEKTFGQNSCYGIPKSAPKFWGNYDRHSIISLDEFTGYKFTPAEFCWYFDRYPRDVETKGGYALFKPEHVIITSNTDPSDWWPPCDEWGAIKKRIWCCKRVYKDKEVCQAGWCKHVIEEEGGVHGGSLGGQEDEESRTHEPVQDGEVQQVVEGESHDEMEDKKDDKSDD